MSLIMHTEKGTLTTSAGTASANISAGNNILMQVFTRANTATTTFDVKLTDIYSNVTFHRVDLVGVINELIQMPAYGNWTFTIENASADEDFEYVLVLRES